MNLFDILGPVMVGPSSSHTAGAVRIGRMARALLGQEPVRAQLLLHGSFASTGEGHGTHQALVAGLLGLSPADVRVPDSFRLARERGLSHEEMHSQVEYLVAHGIASRVGGKRVVIGSAHFIFEDEGCTIPAGEQAKFDGLDPQYSHLYLAASGVLVGVICIADPLRPEAAQVLRQLQKLGITQTVMMTGDSDRTARAIAAQVGVDRCFAEVLPEDKAAFVRDAKAEGHTVVMIGDGINDSPALSAADIGIAIHSGAAIAREIADVTIRADSLEELVTLKAIANALQKRVGSNYRFVLSFNSALILLGALGILPPATSAMLHNLSTLGISLRSMTDLLEQKPSL